MRLMESVMQQVTHLVLVDYMNGFRCKVSNSTSNVALAKPQIARRCGADPQFNKPEASPGNCTYGAKQPFYWFQKERNNVRERHSIPLDVSLILETDERRHVCPA